MTESERIRYLIKHLAGDNATSFAERIGSTKFVISKTVNGRSSARLIINKILEAYPQVNREWLETGEGYPGDLTVELVRSHYEAKIRRNEMIIDHLTRRIDELEKRAKNAP